MVIGGTILDMPCYVTAKHIWLISYESYDGTKMALTDSDVEESEDSSPDKILISWLVEARPLMTSSSRPLASAESWVLILVVQSSACSRISAARTRASFSIRSRSSWEYWVTPFEIIWKKKSLVGHRINSEKYFFGLNYQFSIKNSLFPKVEFDIQNSFFVKTGVFNIILV